jgi:hypothetical protein
MPIVKFIRIGAWLLVGLNLLMAFGVIGLFTRMAPAIAVIIERNERSLQGCAGMLSILAEGGDAPFTDEMRGRFFKTLAETGANATESDEPETLARIRAAAPAALAGDSVARSGLIRAINQLYRINVQAMDKADLQAQHLGQAGAWGVVVMAGLAFVAGLVFIRNFTRRIAAPLEEIHDVVRTHNRGDLLRRCGGIGGDGVSRDIQEIFTGLNTILDERTCWAQEQDAASR